MVALSFLSLLLATTALAAPSQRKIAARDGSVPASAFNLPASFTPLASAPKYVTMAFGVQNYTCTSGNYTSVGAVAQMFDISSLYVSSQSEFLNIQNDAYQLWSEIADSNPLEPYIAQLVNTKWSIPVIGQHYFVKQDGKPAAPAFDFRSTGANAGNPNAIFIGEKIYNAHSTEGSENIDWLQLQEISGGLTPTVYRVYTVLGQPPATCNPGSDDIHVKYAAKYLFQ